MSDPAWDSETTRFLQLSPDDRWRWFAKLLFALTMHARSTYVAGGEGLVDPVRMRRFNELTHRTAQQLKDFAAGTRGMPDAAFLRGVGAELVALEIKPERLVAMLK